MAHPIHEFGFVKNNNSIVDDLKKLAGDSTPITFVTINQDLRDALINEQVIYWDKFGNDCDRSTALYALFPTSVSDAISSEVLYGMYMQSRGKWSGIDFYTIDQMRHQVLRSNKFTIGDTRFGAYIVFDDNWYAGIDFLKDIMDTAIEEIWGYQAGPKNVLAPYKILRSYLGTVLLRAKRQGRLLINDTGDKAVFNTGLLDHYFGSIYVLAEARTGTGEQKTELANPVRIERIRDITSKYGFKINGGETVREKDLPLKATFFETFEDIFFRPDLDIDLDLKTIEHIVTDRVDRLPPEFQGKPQRDVAMQIKTAIGFGLAMAELNYKFIVPQYRPESDSIQFLMPLYLKQKFESTPDVALVLRKEGDFYVPETILTLDWAYQNSRVIAKPDETWLNPATITVTEEE